MSTMDQTGIRTLADFDTFVSAQKNSLTQLDDLGKAIRKKQTALKHLETFQQLKPISDKSKQGFGFMRKQYAEKHQQELNDFVKAVRYMNANDIKAADHTRVADELQQLLDEQAQLRASLAEQSVNPELIDRIRYCVDTVIKAGEEPRQRVSIRAQMAEFQRRNSDRHHQRRQDSLREDVLQK